MDKINKLKVRMSKAKLFQSGISRWFTGWLALGLLLLLNFKSAAITTAYWLAQHGHDHLIAVQADGNHFDVRLSHESDHNAAATDHQHEDDLGLIASLFSTHDHEGTDHVLHFNLSETPDQIRQRNLITVAPVSEPLVASVAINSLFPLPAPPKSATAILAVASPPLTAGLIGLHTTVLLI